MDKKAAEAYLFGKRIRDRSKFDAATDPNDPLYMDETAVKIREQMKLRDDANKKIKEEGKLMAETSRQFGVANATSIMLEVSMTKQLELAAGIQGCLLYTSPSPRDGLLSRMPSSA